MLREKRDEPSLERKAFFRGRHREARKRKVVSQRLTHEFFDRTNGCATLPLPLPQVQVVRVDPSEQRASDVPAKHASVLRASERFDVAIVLSDSLGKAPISHMRTHPHDAVSNGSFGGGGLSVLKEQIDPVLRQRTMRSFKVVPGKIQRDGVHLLGKLPGII